MKSLRADQLAAGFWSRAAIAAGMNDVELALEVCREAGEIEKSYELRLKTGASAHSKPAPSGEAAGETLRRMAARFAGRCGKCSRGIAVGAPIAYDPGNKRAFHEGCAP